jgi:hypothetical protein
MKNKSDTLVFFKHFHKTAQTQHDAVVKMLILDNETQYTNKALKEYLLAHEIHHQATRTYTPSQNRMA